MTNGEQEPPERSRPGQTAERRRSGRLFGLGAVGTSLSTVAPPLDLRILGRTVLHAAIVGLSAGLIGALFFAGLELAQSVLLERLAGYTPLRAHGERLFGEAGLLSLRPWIVMALPAVGALLAGLVSQLAPETRGGGGDAMIHAFHHQGGVIRRRVIWVKALASILTLGTGGSGGREGPTMLIGGSLGSTVGGLLRVSARERRMLMLAGVAAGMAAVFRTPLGAALLATEVLYRDDFEAEALVPAILASVIAYSVVFSIYGQSTLFARSAHYDFIPRQLPLYALLAILIAGVAATFERSLHLVQRVSARLPVKPWARPAFGGLALGVFAVPLILYVGGWVGSPGHALGILGGGYGAAQVAITGATWLPIGWRGAAFLLFLCGAKLFATSLTIGTGGSAGDFGPSLVLGGLFGGAFGRAAAVLLHDPSIDPGAFALVGMGTFYGGIAHVPISSLIMVSELAGSYDLLVPLMLAEGIAFVALRHRTLYHAQVPSHVEASARQRTPLLDVLATLRAADVARSAGKIAVLSPSASVEDMSRAQGENHEQSTFPVVDASGKVLGIVGSSAITFATTETAAAPLTLAADLMQPAPTVHAGDDLRRVAELFVSSGFRQLHVLDDAGAIEGVIDESDVTRAYLALLSSPPKRRSDDAPAPQNGGVPSPQKDL
ncbi:MAG TPA: chloride channel protein [Polyangia bacterium]|jgi:CIC family chloride channel protein|nr:chloride channel protein [Polyangia bacterium]